MIQFDEHIFQMGWFNHQLVMYTSFWVAEMRLKNSTHIGPLSLWYIAWSVDLL